MSSDAEGFLRIMFSITQGILSPFMLVFIIYFLAQVLIAIATHRCSLCGAVCCYLFAAGRC
jgi:hypothetical protein